ncbi:hypothetical protein BaRGS_00006248, partial [Batillaria attramentaria]
MFVLVQMKDTVRIPPNLLHLDTTQAIMEILNKKLANKVVHNVGLCIALWDIVRFEDSFIFPGDGGTHTIVHFRYVMFRPFVDEVLIGKEQLWAWEYDTEEGKHDLYLDIGEEIRFRVMEEKFVDTTPTGPEGLSKDAATDVDPESKKSPYTILVSVVR